MNHAICRTLLLPFFLSGVLAWASRSAAENWPMFRGPTLQGVSSEAKLPTQWSPNENLAWKVDAPGEGHSSPIVWNDRVFLTSASEEGKSLRLVCFDASLGKLLWNNEIFTQSPQRKEGRNSYATPTPVTDGKHVYVVFGDGSVAAVDFEGAIVWSNRKFPYYSRHGLGSSPILWNNLLIMARDASQQASGDEEKIGWQTPWDKSFVMALRTDTGELAWKTSRGMSRIGHVTPNLFLSGPSAQVISGAGDVVQSFDAASGKLLWTSLNEGEGVVPSIVLGEGMAFTASGWGGKESAKAFRLEGNGNQGEANLVWEQKQGMPHIASYVYRDGLLFWANDNGVAMCLEAATGKPLWKERLQGAFSASPIVHGDTVYFTNDDGKTFLVRAARTFEKLGENELGESVQASPGASGGRLYFRTASHLVCIAGE